MNGFMSWHLWIKDVLCDEVVEKYNILIQDDNRPGKTNLFLSLYNYFVKLDIRSFFMLKTIDAYVLKMLDKVRFLAFINILWQKKLNY